MTSKHDSRCFVLALETDASASIKLPCNRVLAYVNVPLSTYCKIRYIYRNLQRHHAVLPPMALLSFLYYIHFVFSDFVPLVPRRGICLCVLLFSRPTYIKHCVHTYACCCRVSDRQVYV